MIFYLTALHAPLPNHMPVAVVGDGPARALSAALEQRMPGGFDITAVADPDAARQVVLNRDAVAAFLPTPGHPELYYAGANGKSLLSIVQQVFGPIAAQSGGQLGTVDVAPGSSGDLMGTSLLYMGLSWAIPGYIAVMFLLRATTIGRVGKIVSLVGMAVFDAVVTYLFGIGLDVIPNNPLVMVFSFALFLSVALVTYGLVPIVRSALPGVAMGLFVLLSMPSSGGAIPKEMVPAFFQWLHPYLPLGQAIDAVRGVLYFDYRGVGYPILVLSCWLALGLVLNGVHFWREREPERSTQDEEIEETVADQQASTSGVYTESGASLSGRVHDWNGRPAPKAVVTLADPSGRQLARTTVDADGAYELHDIAEPHPTAIVSATHRMPDAQRLRVHPGRTVSQDFVLRPVERDTSGARDLPASREAGASAGTPLE